MSKVLHTPLTLMEELHIQLEARFLVNNGHVLPLGDSVDPSPELLAYVRERFQQARDEEDA